MENINTGAPRVMTRLIRCSQPADPELASFARRLGINGSRGESRPRGAIDIIAGPANTGSFDLSDQVMRIGRGETQEIQLACDDAVSRECHALIGYVTERKRYMIFDGGKVNPVWVNGARLHDHELLECGDIVQLGETTLQVNFY